MNSFNKSFNQAFNPAFQQGAAAYQTAQRDKMQEEIQKQAQATQRNQQIIDEASKVGASPVMNPDGSLNAPATYALITKAQAQQDKIRKTAEREDAYNFDLSKKAATFGLNAKPAQTQQPGGGLPQYLAKPGAAPMAQPAEEPLERQVFEAEEAARRKQQEGDLQAKNNVNAVSEYRSLFGSDPSQEHFANGSMTPAGMRAIAEKKAEADAMEARGVAVRYATLETEAAGLSKDSPEGKAMFARRLAYHTAPADSKESMNDMDSMYPELKPGTPEYSARFNQRKVYHFGSAAYRNAINQVGDLYSADPKAWRKEVDRVAALGGFAQPKASPAMEKTLIDWNALQSNQQKLLEMISEFDDKYPQSPFSSYVGPIDNRTLKANLLVNDKASPAAKDAQKILGFYQGVANQRLKDLSGAAVTDGEFQRFLKETGDTENANFMNALQGWHDATAKKYQSQLNALSGYSFPESIARVNGKSPEEWVGFYSQGRQQPQQPPPADNAPQGLSETEQKRLQELRAKLNQQ